MSNISYHNGSSWQTMPNGGLSYHNGSSWVTAKSLSYHNGSGWVETYSGSDQQIYQFVASQTKGARGATWKSSGDQWGGSANCQIGRYVAGFPWFGLVQFANDTSGVSLESRLAIRPVVKSASFSVQRYNDGGFGHGYGNLFIGRYTGTMGDVTPHRNKCDFTYNASKSWTGSGSVVSGSYTDNFLSRSEFVADPLNAYVPSGGISLGTHAQQLVDHAKTNPLVLSHTSNSGTSTGGLGHSASSATYAEQANYWTFWEQGRTVFGTHIGPVLTITLDYI